MLVVLAVLGTVTIVGFALHRPAIAGQLAVFWLLMGVAQATFAVTAWRVARRGPRSARRLWWHLAAGGGLFVLGDVAQLVLVAGDPTAPAAMLGSPLQLNLASAGVLLIAVGLLRHSVGRPTARDCSRLRLDAATVLAAATTFGLWIFEVPAGSTNLTWVFAVVGGLMIQPGLFLVAIFAMLRVAYSENTPFVRAFRTGAVLVAILQGMLQAVPASVFERPRYAPWLLAGNVLVSMLLAVAARLQERGAPGLGRITPRPAGKPYSLLPYAATTAVWGLFGLVLALQGLDWRAWLVGAGAMVTTILVIGRQAGAFRHIAELLRERDALTTRLSELAYRDALTGLANRGLFMQRLHEAMAVGPVTVFLIDLDDFKPVNDEYGHATGDLLLIEVGRRLCAQVRAEDLVARLGGDEFAVLVAGLPADRWAEVIDGVQRSLDATVRIGVSAVRLRASIGMATGSQGSHDPDSLLHEADMAMYAVKAARRPARPITGNRVWQPPAYPCHQDLDRIVRDRPGPSGVDIPRGVGAICPDVECGSNGDRSGHCPGQKRSNLASRSGTDRSEPR